MRQVTLVVTSVDPETGSHSSRPSVSGGDPSKLNTHNEVEEGPIRLDAVVSTGRARAIVDAMLENSDAKTTVLERTLETAVERELESAETYGMLFERLMSTVERILIRRVYESCQGIQTQAAEHLGINRNTLHKKLCKYKLLLATQQVESVDTHSETLP